MGHYVAMLVIDLEYYINYFVAADIIAELPIIELTAIIIRSFETVTGAKQMVFHKDEHFTLQFVAKNSAKAIKLLCYQQVHV